MIYPADPLGAEAREAAQKALAAGLAVALPTDTVYVLAVDPFVPGASDRLFELVGRSREQDLPVFVASVWQALNLATAVPDGARRLMDRCWPGPLTMVLPRDPEVTADLGDDDVTIGARMPRRLRSRSRSAHDSVDSRWPSVMATSSLVPSARTPTMTSAHRRASSRRTLKWTPSAHT